MTWRVINSLAGIPTHAWKIILLQWADLQVNSLMLIQMSKLIHVTGWADWTEYGWIDSYSFMSFVAYSSLQFFPLMCRVLNSLRLDDTYMGQQTEPSLFQRMACYMFSAKSLSGTIEKNLNEIVTKMHFNQLPYDNVVCKMAPFCLGFDSLIRLSDLLLDLAALWTWF